MGDLINGLLNLSRLGRQDLNIETLDLYDLAEEIAEIVSKRDPEREIDFRIDSSGPNCPPAQADKSLMKIMLTNLISNAFKFTRNAKPAVIEFGGFMKEGEVTYFLRDNGTGFDMAYADKLFTPFQRLHGDAEYEGTGIGLAIVEQIIQRHNGRIWMEAEVNKGATFYFTIGSNLQEDQ